MGLAAIVGAGLEVRHVMKVKGPAPVVVLPTPSPSPSASPSASPSVSPSASPSDTPTPTAPARPARAASGIPFAWHSGASGPQAIDGSFGSWRGSRVQIIATWSDTSEAAQRNQGSVADLSGWDGDLDIAVGGLVSGESWSQAASGAFVDRWTEAIRNIRAARSGHRGVVYIRFAHEMTGNWFTWAVTPGNVDDFKRSWRLFHSILEREYPQAKLVFSPND